MAELEKAATEAVIDKNDSLSRKEKVATWKKKGRVKMFSLVGSNGYIAPVCII